MYNKKLEDFVFLSQVVLDHGLVGNCCGTGGQDPPSPPGDLKWFPQTDSYTHIYTVAIQLFSAPDIGNSRENYYFQSPWANDYEGSLLVLRKIWKEEEQNIFKKIGPYKSVPRPPWRPAPARGARPSVRAFPWIWTHFSPCRTMIRPGAIIIFILPRAGAKLSRRIIRPLSDGFWDKAGPAWRIAANCRSDSSDRWRQTNQPAVSLWFFSSNFFQNFFHWSWVWLSAVWIESFECPGLVYFEWRRDVIYSELTMAQKDSFPGDMKRHLRFGTRFKSSV